MLSSAYGVKETPQADDKGGAGFFASLFGIGDVPEEERASRIACRFGTFNCGLRGGTGGAKPGSGVQRFWGPLGASEFDPSFQ